MRDAPRLADKVEYRIVVPNQIQIKTLERELRELTHRRHEKENAARWEEQSRRKAPPRGERQPPNVVAESALYALFLKHQAEDCDGLDAHELGALLAELGVLADALPDAEAARLAGAGLLRATSVPLLKSTAARTVFPEAFKDVGNTHFKAGRMPEAVAGYTQAIESLQKCNGGAGTDVTECEDAAKAVGSVLYANRAAAYLGVQNDKDAKRKATGLEETAAQTDESEQAWDAKVAASIEAAAADARVAVACDPQNAKAHFRLGLAQFQLAERRQGSEADTQQLLTDAAASLATSDELKPNGVTKAKLAAAQKLLDEQVLAGVEPLQQ